MKQFTLPGIALLFSIVLVGCTAQAPTEVEPQAANLYSEEKASETSESEEVETYTVAEVAEHNTPDDCWTVIEGDVVDATSFFGKHPGGDDNLAKACGKDATEMFENVAKHDPDGYKKAKELKVGILGQEGEESEEEDE